MKIVITGGAGFIGSRLCRRILEMGRLHGPGGAAEPVEEIVLFDNAMPAVRPEGLDSRVKFVAGEISERNTVARLVDRPDIGVFHLASVVSAGAEQDFNLAMRVNLDGHINMLEALRSAGSCPRYLFSSSIAVYGGGRGSNTVCDTTRQTPQTTYGMTKSVGELFVNEYTRKGFIDGRSGRLATVIVRPGKPNKAASGFVSGVIREPLGGVDHVLPVDPETTVAVVGYRTVVDAIIGLYEVDGSLLGADRALNLPNISVTVRELVDSLKRVATGRKLGKISVSVDPFIASMVATWPTQVGATRAAALGLPQESSLDAVIRSYIADYMENRPAG